MSLESLDDEITSQLRALAGEEKKKVQWSSFVKQMSKEIILSYNGIHKRTFMSNWKKTSEKASKKLEITFVYDEKDTNVWAKEITPQLSKITTASKSSSNTSSTSNSNYQCILSEDDTASFEKNHQDINDKFKWVLKSSTVVEDEIYKHVKNDKLENPLHSYILRINKLNAIFKADDAKEIEEESGFTDMNKSLPESLNRILMKLDGENDFTSIDLAFQNMPYDRRANRAEYWCCQSILKYLNLFVESNNITPFATEQDFLDDMYGFLKSTKIISRTTTETGNQSMASSYYKNSQRELGTDQKLVRQANGDCSDLTFKYLSSELGCVEIGLFDCGPKGTKELQESNLKSPIMMRSFCKQMTEQYKIEANKIKIVSYIISGCYITAQVMTFTKGFVGILHSSSRLKMPQKISECQVSFLQS